MPLVLTIKVTHLRSLLFRQPDGVNCVVGRVYFGVVPKQSSAVSGLWMLIVNRCVYVGLSLHLLTIMRDLRCKILLI